MDQTGGLSLQLNQRLAGHLGRNGDAHERQHGRCDISKNAVMNAFALGLTTMIGTGLSECAVLGEPSALRAWSGIAVVGNDDDVGSRGLGGINHLLHAVVNGPHGLFNGAPDARMPNHVAVGENSDR